MSPAPRFDRERLTNAELSIGLDESVLRERLGRSDEEIEALRRNGILVEKNS